MLTVLPRGASAQPAGPGTDKRATDVCRIRGGNHVDTKEPCDGTERDNEPVAIPTSLCSHRSRIAAVSVKPRSDAKSDFTVTVEPPRLKNATV